MEGEQFGLDVLTSVPIEHEGAGGGDTTVHAAISEASLEWDPLGDGGYDLLCHDIDTNDPIAWTYFPNIHKEFPLENQEMGNTRPFSSTWVEHTSQLWRSSYPYTFYQTSFDDDIDEYKSCISGEEYYSCESDQTDEEEGYYKSYIETHQTNLIFNNMAVSVKVSVVNDEQEFVQCETRNDKPSKHREDKCTKSLMGKRPPVSATYSNNANKTNLETTWTGYDKNLSKLEYMKYELLNLNEEEDYEQSSYLTPVSSVSSTALSSVSSTFCDNEILKRLVDPLENAANILKNYQLVPISSDSDTSDITTEEPVCGPPSHNFAVDNGEFVLEEEYFEDLYFPTGNYGQSGNGDVTHEQREEAWLTVYRTNKDVKEVQTGLTKHQMQMKGQTEEIWTNKITGNRETKPVISKKAKETNMRTIKTSGQLPCGSDFDSEYLNPDNSNVFEIQPKNKHDHKSNIEDLRHDGTTESSLSSNTERTTNTSYPTDENKEETSGYKSDSISFGSYSSSSLGSEDRLDEMEFDLKTYDTMSRKINCMKEWLSKNDDTSSDDEIKHKQTDEFSEITTDEERDLYNAIHSYISKAVPIDSDSQTDSAEEFENTSLQSNGINEVLRNSEETLQKLQDYSIPPKCKKRKTSIGSYIFGDNRYNDSREETLRTSTVKESPKLENNIDISIEQVIENWLDSFIENAIMSSKFYLESEKSHENKSRSVEPSKKLHGEQITYEEDNKTSPNDDKGNKREESSVNSLLNKNIKTPAQKTLEQTNKNTAGSSAVGFGRLASEIVDQEWKPSIQGPETGYKSTSITREKAVHSKNYEVIEEGVDLLVENTILSSKRYLESEKSLENKCRSVEPSKKLLGEQIVYEENSKTSPNDNKGSERKESSVITLSNKNNEISVKKTKEQTIKNTGESSAVGFGRLASEVVDQKKKPSIQGSKIGNKSICISRKKPVLRKNYKVIKEGDDSLIENNGNERKESSVNSLSNKNNAISAKKTKEQTIKNPAESSAVGVGRFASEAVDQEKKPSIQGPETVYKSISVSREKAIHSNNSEVIEKGADSLIQNTTFSSKCYLESKKSPENKCRNVEPSKKMQGEQIIYEEDIKIRPNGNKGNERKESSVNSLSYKNNAISAKKTKEQTIKNTAENSAVGFGRLASEVVDQEKKPSIQGPETGCTSISVSRKKAVHSKNYEVIKKGADSLIEKTIVSSECYREGEKSPEKDFQKVQYNKTMVKEKKLRENDTKTMPQNNKCKEELPVITESKEAKDKIRHSQPNIGVILQNDVINQQSCVPCDKSVFINKEFETERNVPDLEPFSISKYKPDETTTKSVNTSNELPNNERLIQLDYTKLKTSDQIVACDNYGRQNEELHIIYSDEKINSYLQDDHGLKQSSQKRVKFAVVPDYKAFRNVKEEHDNDYMGWVDIESQKERLDNSSRTLAQHTHHGLSTDECDDKIESKNDAKSEIYASQFNYEEFLQNRGKPLRYLKGVEDNSIPQMYGRAESVNPLATRYDYNVTEEYPVIDRCTNIAETDTKTSNRSQGGFISPTEHDPMIMGHSSNVIKSDETYKSKISHIKEAIKQDEKSFDELERDVNSLYDRFMNKGVEGSYKKRDMKTNDRYLKETDTTSTAHDDIGKNSTPYSNTGILYKKETVSSYIKKYEKLTKFQRGDEKSDSVTSSVSKKIESKTSKTVSRSPENDIRKATATSAQKNDGSDVPNNKLPDIDTPSKNQKDPKECSSIKDESSFDKILMDIDPEFANDTSFDHLVSRLDSPTFFSGCGDHKIIDDMSFDRIVASAEEQSNVWAPNNNAGISSVPPIASETSQNHVNTTDFKSLEIILDEEAVESSVKSIHKKPNNDDSFCQGKNEGDILCEFEVEPEIHKSEEKYKSNTSDIRDPPILTKSKTEDNGKVDPKSSKAGRKNSDISKGKQSPYDSKVTRRYSSSLDRSGANASSKSINKVVCQQDSKKNIAPLEKRSFSRQNTQDNSTTAVRKRSSDVQNVSPKTRTSSKTESKLSKTKLPSFQNLNVDVGSISKQYGLKDSPGYLSKFHKKKNMASLQKDVYSNSKTHSRSKKVYSNNSVEKEKVKRNSQNNLMTEKHKDIDVQGKSSELFKRDKKGVYKVNEIEKELHVDNLEIDVGALASNLESRNHDFTRRHQRKSVEELKVDVDSIAKQFFTTENENLGEKKARSIQSLKDLNIRVQPLMSTFNKNEDEVKTFLPNPHPKAVDGTRIITTPRGCS